MTTFLSLSIFYASTLYVATRTDSCFVRHPRSTIYLTPFLAVYTLYKFLLCTTPQSTIYLTLFFTVYKLYEFLPYTTP
jgi:hypothetical protein